MTDQIHPLGERLTRLCGREIRVPAELSPLEVEAIVSLAERAPGVEPGPIDLWMSPYSDEMQNSLVATGALWMMLTKLDNVVYIRELDHNTITIDFASARIKGLYVLTVEQVRPVDDEQDPF